MSYGKIKETFWTDEKVATWPNEAKLLALYFLSGPHRNMLGCLRIPDGYILADLAWTGPMLAEALTWLQQHDFVVRDPRSGWTLICNQLRHDPPLNDKHGKALLRLAADVPHGAVFDAMLPRLEAALKPIGMGIDTLSKPKPSPEPLPEPEPITRKEEAREAARAEILPPELIPDPRKAIFEDGLRWLAKATDRSRDKLRPLIAKWCHARGDPEVAAAFVAAQISKPVDPIAWIEARLKSNGQRKPSDLQRRRSFAEAIGDVPVGDAEAGGAAGDQTAADEARAGLPHGTG